MLALSLTSCGLKRLLPEGPVLTPGERAAMKENQPSGVEYLTRPGVNFPVLPLMAFGVTYDLDIVIVTEHPAWNMHEFAMIRTPRGPVWLAKDAREGSLEQLLVADLPRPYGFLPEIPVARKSWPLKVKDRSTKDRLDLSISYENFDGEKIKAEYKGKRPVTLMDKRNGSTMGHSRRQVIAVLDLSHRDMGDAASVSYNNKSYGVKKILGLVPFRMALKQTQGGVAVSDFTQKRAGPVGLRTVHRFEGGKTAELTWKVEKKRGFTLLKQIGEFRTLEYRFIKSGKSLELVSILVHQWGKKTPAFRMTFQPALPDLRRIFKGPFRGRFVFDVNGQKSFALGTLEATSTKKGAEIRIIPRNPWWADDRPMKSTIQIKSENNVIIRTERISWKSGA